MKLILGVDPGKKGAIAAYDKSTKSIKALTSLNGFGPRQAYDWIEDLGPIWFATVEELHSMPYQSAQSTFSLGRSYGEIRAVLECLDIPIAPVSPAAWKHVLKLTKDKKLSLLQAKEMFPGTEFNNHDEAEAALLAVFGGVFFSDLFPTN